MVEQNETVVRVDTLKEYRAVLEKWFKKGYDWLNPKRKKETHEKYFTDLGARYLVLVLQGDSYITSGVANGRTTKAMSFKEFMANERGKVTTYEVSAEQLAFIKEARENPYPATYLVWGDKEYKGLFSGYEYTEEFERDLLKYVSGDENVVFKVKNPDTLYLLKGKDSDGDTVYFRLNVFDIPTYAYDESDAFKAPHDEILRWDNPFWNIERVTD